MIRESKREKIREEEDGKGKMQAVMLKSRITEGMHEGNSIMVES